MVRWIPHLACGWQVCGYFVPSPVDGTMEFFDADATGLGRLRPDPIVGAAWEPDPGQPATAGARPGADIANPFLAAIAESILAADRTAALGGATSAETVLQGVQDVIDTTRRTAAPAGDERPASPVAVLRAAILPAADDHRRPPGMLAGLLGYFVGDDYTRMHVVDPAIRAAVDGAFAATYLADPAFTVPPGMPVALTLLIVPDPGAQGTTGPGPPHRR